MQFSKNWLKDFIDLDLSTEEVCYQLTMAGIEVDYFENVKSAITGNDAIIKLSIGHLQSIFLKDMRIL